MALSLHVLSHEVQSQKSTTSLSIPICFIMVSTSSSNRGDGLDPEPGVNQRTQLHLACYVHIPEESSVMINSTNT